MNLSNSLKEQIFVGITTYELRDNLINGTRSQERLRRNCVGRLVPEYSIPRWVIYVLQRLWGQGYQAYLVGGAPRDLLLNRRPSDWDVTTDAQPEQVESIFEVTRPTGKRFGTITVVLDNNHVEVTTFRGEGPYSDGRRPDWVRFSSSLKEDLMRRDFTINAIAYNPLKVEWVDPFGGRRDLRRRRVCAVGDPTMRFKEDGLRMVRFYRFQSTLGFSGERHTVAAITPEAIRGVSAERIREEMSKLLTGIKPGGAILGMHNSGLLREFLPEVALMDGVRQGSMHRYDVLKHAVAAVDAIEPKLALRWAALLHDVGKPITKVIDERGIHFYGHDQTGEKIVQRLLKRLTYGTELIDKVSRLVRHHMFYCSSEVTDAGLRRLVAKTGPELIKLLLELRRADIIATSRRYDLAWRSYSECCERIAALLAEETVFTLKDLAIKGDDLCNLGLEPGPIYGEILNAAFQWVLEDLERNKKEILIEFVRDYISTS
jgi:tRNA nucleotidyltransferase (CCA-adding enzyme)